MQDILMLTQRIFHPGRTMDAAWCPARKDNYYQFNGLQVFRQTGLFSGDSCPRKLGPTGILTALRAWSLLTPSYFFLLMGSRIQEY